MTQMCTECHYMNIKVIHRQTRTGRPHCCRPLPPPNSTDTFIEDDTLVLSAALSFEETT